MLSIKVIIQKSNYLKVTHLSPIFVVNLCLLLFYCCFFNSKYLFWHVITMSNWKYMWNLIANGLVTINCGKDKDYTHIIKVTHFLNSKFKMTHFCCKVTHCLLMGYGISQCMPNYINLKLPISWGLLLTMLKQEKILKSEWQA